MLPIHNIARLGSQIMFYIGCEIWIIKGPVTVICSQQGVKMHVRFLPWRIGGG
jgi:hypothetical protein